MEPLGDRYPARPADNRRRTHDIMRVGGQRPLDGRPYNPRGMPSAPPERDRASTRPIALGSPAVRLRHNVNTSKCCARISTK